MSARGMGRYSPLLVLALGGCGVFTQLAEVGSPPALSKIANPTQVPGYRPVSLPMPPPAKAPTAPDSLWRVGAREFFKDQRASAVGDLVTVLVNIADTAALQDKTSAVRNTSEAMGAPDLLGLESSIPHIFSHANPASLLSTNGADSTVGAGTIARGETVTLRLAGEVTQVLPNGNLVVEAHQQVRVNSELRDLTVSGVVRPQDIASDNTITHDRMAEARISYGGRGQLTYVQTAPYGQQVLNAVKPF
jgi:flagellar L-ring protein precursor FlgH